MLNPLVFLATSDLELERFAIEAIGESNIDLLRAGTLRGAHEILDTLGSEIALAIVDVNLQRAGHPLLHILAAGRFAFPIVALAEDPDSVEGDEVLARAWIDVMPKPVAAYELAAAIEYFCPPLFPEPFNRLEFQSDQCLR